MNIQTKSVNRIDGLNLTFIYRDNNQSSIYETYSYDNSCRLTSVTTPLVSTSYEYDANGNRTAVHYVNGVTTNNYIF